MAVIPRRAFRLFLLGLLVAVCVSIWLVAIQGFLKKHVFPPVMKFVGEHMALLAYVMGFVFLICSLVLVFIVWWVGWADERTKREFKKYVSKLVAPDYYRRTGSSDFYRAIKTYLDQAPPGVSSEDEPKDQGADVRDEIKYSKEKLKEGLKRGFGKQKQPEKRVYEDGTYKTHHKNGKVKEVFTYKNGVLDGVYMKYYPDGSLRQEKEYKAGKLDGIFRAWDEMGILYFEIAYKNDIHHGEEKIYFKTGVLQYKNTYNQGKLINRKTYGGGGELKSDYDFH